MLGKLLSPFTTAAPSGVALRDLVTGIGAVLAVLGALGFLSPEQVRELTTQAPALLTGLGAALYAGMTIYRSLFKSSSDTAAAVSKAVDANADKLPEGQSITIKTPIGVPDIVVPTASKG